MKVGKSVAMWEVIFENLFIDDENNVENLCLSDSKMKTFQNSCFSVALFTESEYNCFAFSEDWGMMVQDILQQWSTIISIMHQFGNN